jgi:aldose 1-epimerase
MTGERPHSTREGALPPDGRLPSGEQIELRHGDQRAVVVEVGAGLRRYAAGGRELLDGYGESEMATVGRGQSLIPWPNRVRDGSYEFAGERYQLPLSEPEKGNSIHGLVRWVNWTLANRDRGRARMEYVLHPQEGYPFTLALSIEYSLGDGGLTVRSSATNVGQRPCPYGAGAHPYLTVGTELIDSCTLQAPGSTWLRADERAIPLAAEPVAGTEYDFRSARQIDTTQLDTGYCDLVRDPDGLARVTLSAPDSGIGVTLWQDDSYPYLMLFTGDAIPQAGRRRRGLGVEPMTCAPNAFQSGDGLLALQPGESFTGSWGVSPALAMVAGER